MAEMLTLEAFEEASEKVREVTLETKLVESPHFSAQTGNRVWLKPENMQRTGAYKVRGAYYKISTLSPEELGRGIVTASAGNHAQGVAFAATRAGARSVVVMPETTPLIKVERTKHYGAEVVLHGDVYDEACDEAMRLAEEEGYTFIHPFNDPCVSTGQGTIAMEVVQELPLVDTILVPVGGGGLACGVATFAKLYNPKIRVIGVEPEGAPSLTAALEAGRPVKLPSANTIADGTAVLEVGDKVFPYLQENLDDVMCVPDDELVVAFLDMVENHKMIVENSGLLHGGCAQAPSSREQACGLDSLRRQHGRHHDELSGAARPHHARPHLHRERAAPRPPGHARARGLNHRGAERQRHQARAQPVRLDQPQRRRGAARHDRGLWHRAQAPDRGGPQGSRPHPHPRPDLAVRQWGQAHLSHSKFVDERRRSHGYRTS